ncbi:MAG: N-acetylmuramoyl-L-alanine amidase [Oscillospiraceae bacterium]|nr:N-acetylmuramoyl-L-alanine amidase [Oscillospiraceae bacterium]
MSKKIYISAGHGFNGDPGAVNGSRKESDDNLALSVAVEQEAKSRGYATKMARTVKNLSPGIDRVADAKNWGADCYIEIHRNAGVASANGFEVWTSRNPSAASAKLAEVLYKHLEPRWNSNPKRGIKKNNGNVDRLESLNPHMPCVLTEHGFVSNSSDNAKFDSTLIAQAKAIVDGLDEIYGKQSGNADNSVPFSPYTVRVTVDTLNVRIRAGVNHAATGVKVKFKEVYTIVEEADGADTDGKVIRWGRLKSGAGWIALTGYTVRV